MMPEPRQWIIESPHAPIKVEIDQHGNVWIEQGNDMIEIMPASLDDLIKALQSAKETK